MVGIIDFEIPVAPEIVGKKPDAQLEGNNLNGLWQHDNLPGCEERSRFLEISVRDRIVQVGVKCDSLEVRRILPCRVCAGPNAVAEVKVYDAGLDGVEIKHA